MKHVLCIPCGRPANLDVLIPYIMRDRALFDRCDLWYNTAFKDQSYVIALSKSQPDFFRLVELEKYVVDPDDRAHSCGNLKFFLFGCVDPDTIYIKMDDDVCWVEEGALARLIAFREENPHYLQVIANIVNNAVCSYIHQRQGCFSQGDALCQPNNCWCTACHSNHLQAEKIHRAFLADLERGDISRWKFNRWEMLEYLRSPNHVYAWFGRDYARLPELYPGTANIDEEGLITQEYAKFLMRPCCYVGDAMVAHFSYAPQHRHLYGTGLLERYAEIAKCLARSS